MSFPPRPPMGMPQMMPGAYYTPMGMVPMGMRMMAPPQMIRPVVNSQKQGKKLIPQEIPKNEKDDKPPVTTVFVGNISDKAPDVMIKQMLQRCGNVLSWKRVQGASGKLQAFGFCEYEDPEATLRCIRLLNEWYIPDKKLVVKVDAKTKTLLDDYRSKKKAAETTAEEKKEKEKKEEENGDKENGEIRDDESSADELDEFTKREDRVATAGLEAIMMEYAEEMNKAMASQEQEKKPAKIQMIKEGKDVKDVGLDGLEVEEETKFIINREIRSFRDLHKDEEVDEEKEKREAERRNEELRRRRDREREKLREREREKEKSRREERVEKRRVDDRRSRERERTRSRTRSPGRNRSPPRNRNYNRRDRREREVERERERTHTPDRSRRKEQELEDEEEAKERRKLEKKLREKEAAYKERLTNWEARERKKSRENEKEKEREEERKIEEAREGRRLKEFLEDYDDLRDDPKFFKGSALARRMKEREKEKEADARDRQREKEEFEEIKRRLMSEGHPDPEAELARIEREREEHLKPRLQIQEVIISPEHPVTVEKIDSSDSSDKPVNNNKMQSTLKPIDSAPMVSNTVSPLTDDDDDDDDDNTMFSLNNEDISEDSQQPVYGPNPKAESSKLSFSSIKLGTNSNSPAEAPAPTTKRKKLTVGDVFNQDDDSSESKKRKLIPLDYDEEKKPNSAEEKRNKIKILIDSIPTAKEELFAFTLDWSIVDQALMDKRIKPWINKKIVEYIGEEEATLTEFICQKVIARSTPASIQNDVAMVLDEEAEVFVVKMWRLLVYETEAKKLGLVK
ncbi:hypothetical protein SNE40_010515 [Patella caerulea]|uniref:RNA-binding protein 25 n=1 Tax=Patella caerulea TaxID=87958 RepID=A0AAN8JW56_PATCE